MFLPKKVTLKIDSAASDGSHGNYMKYVSFLWPPVVAAQALHSNAKLLALEKLSPNPEFSYVPPPDPTISFQLRRKRLPIKIAFAVTIN
jgi:hypothetical protein